MNKVAVSVIVPFYNAQNSLERCLLSVCTQSLRNIEIICIDDGSSDEGHKKISAFRSLDNRIVLIKFNENKGVAAARNKGIEVANGEYVFFVDADDYLPEQNVLMVLYENARKFNAEISGGNVHFCNPSRLPFNKSNFPFFKNNQLIQFKNFQFCYGFWCFLYQKNFLIQNEIFFPSLRRFQDPPFLISAMTKARNIYVCSALVYCYTVSQKNINEKSKIDDIILVIKLSLNIESANNLLNLRNLVRIVLL